jgi:predicted AlkP superfamily phosphohydrolase/phosphomutase
MKQALGALLAIVLVLAGAVGGWRLLDRLSWEDGRTELLLVGIDGADWRVIDPLIEAGEMPNLASLLRRGVRADLRSIEPTLSPRIWTTISSGKLPEKHGVKDFYADSRIVQSRRLWDILEAEGWNAGLFAWPITWPPREIDGFMVPDWMARGPETYPPELSFLKEMESRARLDKRSSMLDQAGYFVKSWANGVSLPTLLGAAAHVLRQKIRPDTFLDRYRVLRSLQYRIHTDAFSYLRNKEKPRVALFYSDVVDKVSHLFWKYYVPEEFEGVDPAETARYREGVRDAYRQADWSLGRILRDLDDEATVAVMSDHGFRSTQNLGSSRYRLRLDALLKWTQVPDQIRTFKVSKKLYLRAVDGNARAGEITAEARRRLAAVTHQPTGRPLFRIDEQPDGSFAMEIDYDLSLAEDDPITFGDSTRLLGDITSTEVGGGGTHRITGIFVIACPVCRVGETAPEMSVADVTPTLLYLLGLPVARDMDGLAATDLFQPEFVESHELAYVDTYDEGLTVQIEEEVVDEQTERMLRSIGYVE